MLCLNELSYKNEISLILRILYYPIIFFIFELNLGSINAFVFFCCNIALYQHLILVFIASYFHEKKVRHCIDKIGDDAVVVDTWHTGLAHLYSHFNKERMKLRGHGIVIFAHLSDFFLNIHSLVH